ncbi:hypothetical protein V8F33_003005 [Rhypophila sp. PSN 637]
MTLFSSFQYLYFFFFPFASHKGPFAAFLFYLAFLTKAIHEHLYQAKKTKKKRASCFYNRLLFHNSLYSCSLCCALMLFLTLLSHVSFVLFPFWSWTILIIVIFDTAGWIDLSVLGWMFVC